MSYYIIGYIICSLYNFLYLTFFELLQPGFSFKVKDLFDGFRIFMGLLGPLVTLILIIEDVKNIIIFIGNKQIRKGK
jgi:hypothetical protein